MMKYQRRDQLTVETGVVGLNESLLDLAIFDKKDVALAAVVTEDSGAIEAEVEGLGELAGGIAQEANLENHICQTFLNVIILAL